MQAPVSAKARASLAESRRHAHRHRRTRQRQSTSNECRGPIVVTTPSQGAPSRGAPSRGARHVSRAFVSTAFEEITLPPDSYPRSCRLRPFPQVQCLRVVRDRYRTGHPYRAEHRVTAHEGALQFSSRGTLRRQRRFSRRQPRISGPIGLSDNFRISSVSWLSLPVLRTVLEFESKAPGSRWSMRIRIRVRLCCLRAGEWPRAASFTRQ